MKKFPVAKICSSWYFSLNFDKVKLWNEITAASYYLTYLYLLKYFFKCYTHWFILNLLTLTLKVNKSGSSCNGNSCKMENGFTPLFPDLTPKLTDPIWFNVDKAVDEDAELAQLEQEHTDWVRK